MMRTAPRSGAERALQRFRRDPTSFPGKTYDLDTAAIKFRRAAFVRGDVRLLMAEHGPPGLRQMRECERVGRGSARHQKNRDPLLKNGGQLLLDSPRPGIASVGQCRALIGL